jgi:hypothetical protein
VYQEAWTQPAGIIQDNRGGAGKRACRALTATFFISEARAGRVILSARGKDRRIGSRGAHPAGFRARGFSGAVSGAPTAAAAAHLYSLGAAHLSKCQRRLLVAADAEKSVRKIAFPADNFRAPARRDLKRRYWETTRE